MCYCGIHECYLCGWDAVGVFGARAFSESWAQVFFFLEGGMFVHFYDSMFVCERK